jgi:hypothetical protein
LKRVSSVEAEAFRDSSISWRERLEALFESRELGGCKSGPKILFLVAVDKNFSKGFLYVIFPGSVYNTARRQRKECNEPVVAVSTHVSRGFWLLNKDLTLRPTPESNAVIAAVLRVR